MSISASAVGKTAAAWTPSTVVDLVQDGSTSPAERLPDAFTVNFGDAPMLSEFCLRADAAVADMGIDLYYSGDLAELKRINEANADSWFPLLPSFDVAYGGLDATNSYLIYGVHRETGDVVATQAGRIYLMKSLTETCRTLELLYADPSAHAEPGERCYFSGEAAAAADLIRGRVVMSGCTWFKPGVARGQGLARVFPRLSRAYARARFGTNFTISTVRRHHVERGIAAAYGYSKVAYEFQWTSSWMARSGAAENPVSLVWMDAAELEADLRAWNRDAQRTDAAAAMSSAAD